MDFLDKHQGRECYLGTEWTCLAHIITAIIGSGVLSLGFSVAQLGWIFGPLVLFTFACITMMTATMLCGAYRSGGDPYTGKRNKTYSEAVAAHLGVWDQWFCAVFQYGSLWTSGIGYTVTASTSIVAAKRAICFHNHDVAPTEAPCSFESTLWTVLFGGLGIILSQIPNFGHLWWLSYLAASMSFAYAFIGLGLGIGKDSENHFDHGSILGVNNGHSPASSVWNVFMSLGSMASAYSYTMVLVEVADTIKQVDPNQSTKDGMPPRSEADIMRKSTVIGITITTLFYLSVGCTSYAGFGDASPGNLLTGFGFFNPYWLVAAANIFVFIHLVGGYQVYMQPIMSAWERTLRDWFPENRLLNYEVWYDVPVLQHVAFSPLMLVSRTIIVVVTTVIACLLPFFNAIISLMGAAAFLPLTVYFPIQIWLKRHNVPRSDIKSILLNILCGICLLVSISAAIGSTAGIVESVKDYKPFQNKVRSLGGGGHSV